MGIADMDLKKLPNPSWTPGREKQTGDIWLHHAACFLLSKLCAGGRRTATVMTLTKPGGICPGRHSGYLHHCARVYRPGQEVMYFTPVYSEFHDSVVNSGRTPADCFT